MIKTLLGITVITASMAAVQAQPLPAPPMQEYTPSATSLCETQVLQVYFQDQDSQLNPASAAMLQAAQDELKGCVVGPVSLQANAGDAATYDQAQSLAQARLAAVTHALEAHELAGTRLDAKFEASASNSQIAMPAARSVEIRVSAWAPQIG